MKPTQEDLLASAIVSAVEKMITDDQWEFEDPSLHFPVRLIVNTLKNTEHCTFDEDNFDTNGWAWDWWLRFTYKEVQFVISGSGYDGGLSISLDKK